VKIITMLLGSLNEVLQLENFLYNCGSHLCGGLGMTFQSSVLSKDHVESVGEVLII